MNFKTRSIIISIVFSWPLDSFMLYFLTMRSSLTGGTRFWICFGGGLVISMLMVFGIQLFSANTRNQNAIEGELEKNGYSDRFIELSQAEVNRLSSKRPHQQYYIRYVINLANAYLYKKEPYQALEAINMLNPNYLKHNTVKSNPVELAQLLSYYSVQMCICEDLNDLQRAHNVMNDAEPILEKCKGKGTATDIISDEMNVTYCCLCGDFETAMDYAEHTMVRSIKGQEYIGYALRAKVFLKMGNLREARKNLDIATGYAKKKLEMDFIEQFDEKLKEAERNIY